METTARVQRVAGWIVAALVGMLVVAALAAIGGDQASVTFQPSAQEDDAGESADGDAEAADHAGRRHGPPHCRRGPAGHAIHGELIVPDREPGEDPGEGEDGSFVTRVVDRGEVTALDDDSLTLERPDGESVTVTLTDDTRTRGEPEVGNPVHVVADEDGNALMVGAPPVRDGAGDEDGGAEGVGLRRACHAGPRGGDAQ